MKQGKRRQRCWVSQTQADDGMTITYRTYGDPNMSEQSRQALEALVKAAYAHMTAQHGDQPPDGASGEEGAG